jgi:hypothetical protein
MYSMSVPVSEEHGCGTDVEIRGHPSIRAVEHPVCLSDEVLLLRNLETVLCHRCHPSFFASSANIGGRRGPLWWGRDSVLDGVLDDRHDPQSQLPKTHSPNGSENPRAAQGEGSAEISSFAAKSHELQIQDQVF